MLNNCYSLLSLDLSYFNTSQVTKMAEMFYNCSSLTSLDLSNFNISKINSAYHMFGNCNNLEYLNIENFIFFQGKDYGDIFENTPKNIIICANESNINEQTNPIFLAECVTISCSDDWKEKRKKINLKDNTCVENCENIDKIEKNGKCLDIPDILCLEETPFIIFNEKICSDNCSLYDIVEKNCFLPFYLNNSEDIMLNNTLNYLKSNSFPKEMFKKNDYITFKEKRVKFTLSNLIFDNNNELNDCKQSFNEYDDTYNFYLLNISVLPENYNEPKNVYEVYFNKENNESFTKFNLNELYSICKLRTEISKCEYYSIESIIHDSCLTCSSAYGYHPMYNFDNSTFVQCYQKINEKNNSDEILITDDNTILISNSIINLQCDKNNSKYIPANETCIDKCINDKIYQYEFNNTCYKDCPNNTIKSKKNEFYCELICPKEKPYLKIENQKCIENCTISDIFKNICKISYKEENKTLKEDLGKKIVEEILSGNLGELLDQIIKEKSDIIIEEENSIHQISSLDFQKNNTNFTSIDFEKCEDLLRQKYLSNETEEDFIIYKIEHIIEGFNIPIIEYVLFTQNGSISLDLSICDNTLIKYDIPVTIDENDEDKYDPSSDFYNDKCNKYSTEQKVDMTLYDRKNEFNNNNMSLCESKCEFRGYNSTTSKAICFCQIKNNMTYSYDDINQNDLLTKIQSDKSNSNLDVTQCMEVFGSTEELKSNSGFYLLLFILIIFIIVFIIFCIKGRELLKNKIDEIIYNKFEKNQNKKEKSQKNNNKTILDNHHDNKKSINKKIRTKTKKKIKKAIQKSSSNFTLKERKNPKEGSSIITEVILDNKKNSNLNPINETTNISSNIPDSENDYEMNNLSYIETLKYDKRSCCEYYKSLIKNKQLFAFTFCSFNDYNSGIIKKFIFFLSFALHYTINALFFNDSNMHQIYEDQGKYNFSYQFPKILISAICSTVILRIILQTLVLTDKSILKVKQQTTKELAINMKNQILKCINIKFFIFFVLNFILLVLFWFYLTCFNAIYENTQIYLIENTMISFGLSLIYPFVINIIPSILRMCSLEQGKKDKNTENCLYTISKFIQVL